MYFNTFSVQNYVDVSPIQKLIYLRKISPILIWPTGPLASAGTAPAQASARAASSPVSCQRSTAGRGSWRPHRLASPPSHPQHPQAHLTRSPRPRLAGWSGPSPHPPQRGPVWPHPPPGAAPVSSAPPDAAPGCRVLAWTQVDGAPGRSLRARQGRRAGGARSQQDSCDHSPQAQRGALGVGPGGQRQNCTLPWGPPPASVKLRETQSCGVKERPSEHDSTGLGTSL